ncbi:hypothetical protein Gogos_004978 [Gossypium gossypioides]|uniref:Uncharacterized protein n=1 Tax=Gossypium gossypioides TaxID=34282 RepID=A0A7J9CI43_GOSGO|nr:hypothetical protein [Gossypium gossypioides]
MTFMRMQSSHGRLDPA